MDALAAAREINRLWLSRLANAGVEISVADMWPGDEEVTEVIERYLQTRESEEQN